jgi:hypothetical protein
MLSKAELISLLCFVTLLSLPVLANVQQPARSTLDEKLDKEGCVTESLQIISMDNSRGILYRR